jgi:hypothetical protein
LRLRDAQFLYFSIDRYFHLGIVRGIPCEGFAIGRCRAAVRDRNRAATSWKGGLMKHVMGLAAAAALFAAAPTFAGDIVYKPIDTNKLVVKPSRAAANLSAQTIKLVGNTAASAAENNGWVKTINNLFSKKIAGPPTIQAGRSALPTPAMFSSTQYKSFNTPVMPRMQPVRR